jgi:hypothetical protein
MHRSPRFRSGARLLVALAAALLTACSGAGTLRERLAPRTPHERYADALRTAGLDRTALGSAWLLAADARCAARPPRRSRCARPGPSPPARCAPPPGAWRPGAASGCG